MKSANGRGYDWRDVLAGPFDDVSCNGALAADEPCDLAARQEAYEQFLARDRHTRQVREAAVSRLAAVLHPEAECSSPTEGPPLLVAARAVSDALGVPIQPPAASEDAARGSEPLEAIARASQLRIRQVALGDAWWKQDGGPLLAYTRDDRRPVALLPVSARRYELFDPVRQTRTPIRASLAAMLDPVAYAFYRTFPATVQRAYQVLAFGFQGYRRDLRQGLLTGLLATLLGLLTPYATALLIDRAIPNADRGVVVQLGLALLAAALGQALFRLAQGIALVRQQTGSLYAIEPALWDRLLKLPPAFFRCYTSGDLRVRMDAMHAIHKKLGGATLRTSVTSVLALLNLVVMLYYSVTMALLVGVAALLVMGVTIYAGVFKLRDLRPLQRLRGEVSGLMVQLIQGMAKLRIAGAEERAFAHWATAFSQQQVLRHHIQCLEDRVTVFNAVLPTVMSAALFWGIMPTASQAALPAEQLLSTGAFLAFYVAFGSFMSGVTSLSNTFMDVLDVATQWERVKPIFEQEPEVATDNADPGQLSGRLALDHVTFAYQSSGPVILDKVSLHAEPGEFIALVGPSGSGKSTILRLLLGFERPQFGAVFYDEQDLAHLDVTAVRRQVGTVLQQNRLMAASIFDNIAGGAAISLDDAWEAARAAGLDTDIEAMPMGMHTFVSEGGSNLSGGQRQRLLIARALVFKPAIVLFDEATSALDNRTQAIVTASLDRLHATRVVIAHRLSTIRNADRIYVLDQGQVVQSGHFEELVRQEGRFAQLMARQMPDVIPVTSGA
nr:NHLP bacteriocin export ABC transporter permease/ATPase subunit [Candidatus Entotheonella palauensis]